MSNYKANKPGGRADVHSLTGGRCFYCGIHVRLADEPLPRDWLAPRRPNLRMVPEHGTPLSRGGTDHADNLVPACSACNSSKGALTIDEFEFLSRLRALDFSFQFWGNPPPADRDWLCCYSEAGMLFKHNMPQALVAYGRGKVASA